MPPVATWANTSYLPRRKPGSSFVKAMRLLLRVHRASGLERAGGALRGDVVQEERSRVARNAASDIPFRVTNPGGEMQPCSGEPPPGRAVRGRSRAGADRRGVTSGRDRWLTAPSPS